MNSNDKGTNALKGQSEMDLIEISFETMIDILWDKLKKTRSALNSDEEEKKTHVWNFKTFKIKEKIQKFNLNLLGLGQRDIFAWQQRDIFVIEKRKSYKFFKLHSFKFVVLFQALKLLMDLSSS